MQNYRKIFFEGLNADDDFSVIKQGEWVNASNIRTFTTDSGSTGRIETVGGTELLFDTLPATGQNYCIGGTEDEAKNRILFFNWNSLGEHGIYCYDKQLAAGFKVLINADVTGGLNFSKYAYIHSCYVANGCLYWVNGIQNQPRRINIESGIKAYSSSFVTTFIPYTLPVSQPVISWVRKPGALPPVATKVVQTIPIIDYNAVKDGAFQFCYRYNFRGYEYSTLSPLSSLINYNEKNDSFNRVDIIIPFEEKIDQDVLSVDLCVRFVEDNSYFIIKTWDKLNTSDSIAITNHNAGVARLTYQFYNDVASISLDAVYKVKQFDSLPNYAYATDIAKNRSFLGNYIEGYDTPKETSLTISYTPVNFGVNTITTVVGNWYLLHFRNNNFPTLTNYDFYVIQTNTTLGLPLSSAPVYYWKIAAAVPPFPATLNSTDLTFVGSNLNDMVDYYRRYVNHDTRGFPSNQSLTDWAHTSVINIPGTSTSFLSKALKSSSNYEVAITFYDQYQRKCGVKKSNTAIIIPDAKLTNNYVPYLSWFLSNVNAVNEIPDWAYFYSINITKCLSTRFFMDGAGLASYAKKDNAGSYIYQNTYSNDLAGIAIDVTCLEAFSMGYVFNEGDIIKFVLGVTEYNFPIVAADGKYVIVQLADIGPLSPTNVTFEISTPYKKQISEVFYEVGQMYPVTNPGDILRTYSITTGTINGDIYLFKRAFSTVNWVVEAMNINDKYWKFWHTDAGRGNLVDTIGQVHKITGICFSNAFIEGSRVNGLSSFEALNTESLDSENGSIQKLQLANKIQLDGSVMLAICEEETVSIYLGEQELFDTQGSAFVARAASVIGTHKSLKGSFGTKNPESVFQYNGLVFYFDVRNASFVQYSDNGLFPISKNKFVRPANLFSKKFASLNPLNIEDLGSRPYVIGGFDPYHKEALFTIPTTEAPPPKGYLIDYPKPPIIYPYDIYDGMEKTLMYKHEADIWMGSMSFAAEKFIRMGNDLYSFKNGKLYIHNQSSPCKFYGIFYPARLMYSNNPGAIHTFLSIGLESNKKPSFVHFRTEDPYEQSTDLLAGDFVSREGVIEASLLRDRLSPNVRGDYDSKQLSGDRMFGKALLTMLEYEFETDTKKLELRASNLGNNINKGTLLNVQ